jgi:hypothetical protein
MLGFALALILGGLNVVSTSFAAIQQAITPYVYAGNCASATPANIGQYCSKEVATHGDIHAYLVGRTFSEYSTWVFIQQQGDEWISLGVVGYDETTTVPWP